MGAIKRKADQGNTPSKKEKGAPSDRSAKRRKSDVAAEPAPAKPKSESSAPKPSVFKDEEKSFPRGGASVLTPLEHKQIHIKANQDVLFEQTGGKRTGGDDDGFSDMGSDDGEKAAPKAKKKFVKKGKKSHADGETEEAVRAEGLSYKVSQSQPNGEAILTIAETVAWNHHPRLHHRHHPPGYRPRSPQQPCRLRPAHRRIR
jgi:rRNA biogenesis protein RRP5